jgi:serine/threonine-protein kinase
MSEEERNRLLAHGLPPPGTLLLGRYRVERLLGAGGMGAVLLAHHVLLDQWVALKLLHAGAQNDPEKVTRFFNEARAAARIQGDHIVRVYDVGQLEDGRPYMCMEHLQGCDLGQWMRSSGPLSVPAVVATLIDAGDALAQAHAMGVVHRDLKPSNLYLAEQADGARTLKVLDFGIAKMQPEGDNAELTTTGTIMGTPAYMAPEQMRSSRRTDHRADIWALGVIAFELLSRKRPFAGDSLGDILFSIAERPAVSLDTLVPEVPPELASIIARCLEREPDRRFDSILELLAALEPFAPPGHTESPRRKRHVVAAPGKSHERISDAFVSAPTAHDSSSRSAPRMDPNGSVGPSSRSSSFKVERSRFGAGAALATVAFVAVGCIGAWLGLGHRSVSAGSAGSDSAVADVTRDAGGPALPATAVASAAEDGVSTASVGAAPAPAPPPTVATQDRVDAGRGAGLHAPGSRTSGRTNNPATGTPNGMATDTDWSGVKKGAGN